MLKLVVLRCVIKRWSEALNVDLEFVNAVVDSVVQLLLQKLIALDGFVLDVLA